MLLGSSGVQVCTAVMHYGYRLVDDLIDGMSTYLRGRGLVRPADLVGRALPAITSWGELDQSYKVVARIDESTCVHCDLCHRACWDGAHQAIDRQGRSGSTVLTVDPDRCVGCALCQYVCPVDGCITMVEADVARA